MPSPDTPLLTQPTDRLVGIAGDPATLQRAVQALHDTGLPEQAVTVRCCEQDVGRFSAADDQGGLTRVVRAVQRALGDETEKLARLDAALASGAAVVEVALDTDRSDAEELRDARKRELGAALVGAGATEVAYYGPWAVEDLDLTV